MHFSFNSVDKILCDVCKLESISSLILASLMEKKNQIKWQTEIFLYEDVF